MSVPEVRQRNNKLSEHSKAATDFAPGVTYTTVVFVNAYFVDAPDGGGSWVLVDTGLLKSAMLVRRAAEQRYGSGARPDAIILTHGHFDHAGNALHLAREWDVPIYAHRLEMPYLTGKSDYARHSAENGSPRVGNLRRAMVRRDGVLAVHRAERSATASADFIHVKVD